ncbi:phosphoglycolate phosphatase [Pantoea sp. BAV 3049]|uniref:phosphoglycolate phosphatase n=1 Tax=Pantoea sp. BAV 3049 TaxID=2654188 RepID=UPI00131C0F0F|nr:phosphoglycolate phosphatase [Pantoea sp. BAV 3049]
MADSSFSDTDVTYPDGQSNRVRPPDEIFSAGFKPPVKNSDGTVQKGDVLAANHLNYILHDLYARIAALEAK